MPLYLFLCPLQTRKTSPRDVFVASALPGRVKEEERQLSVLCPGCTHLTGFQNLSRSPGKSHGDPTPPPHWEWVMPPGKDLKHIHLSPGPSRAAGHLRSRWESLLVWLLAVLFHSINIYWASTCASLRLRDVPLVCVEVNMCLLGPRSRCWENTLSMSIPADIPPKQQVNGEKNWISNSTVDRICQGKKMEWSISMPLKLCCAHHHLETLLKSGLWHSGSRVVPIFCIYNKLLGDADTACLRTTFRAVKGLPNFHTALIRYFAVVWAGRR